MQFELSKDFLYEIGTMCNAHIASRHSGLTMEKQTDPAQVQVLSCAFAAKKNMFFPNFFKFILMNPSLIQASFSTSEAPKGLMFDWDQKDWCKLHTFK